MSVTPRVLLVDDEPGQVAILGAILERDGFEVASASTAEMALAMVRESPPAIVLTDLKLSRRDGLHVLNETLRLSPETSVIVVTAHGSVDTAVEAMKRGAFDYLTKPLARDTVLLTVRRALEKTRLLAENRSLRQELQQRFSIDNMIGDHGSMQEVSRLVMKVAASTATVLIRGESGTGKELIAKAIHYNSPRSSRALDALNCAAIPETLLESELFGYEKGAFTGAVARKIGLFEQASGGTLFLDEVGDLGPAMQAKLLRALQEREIRRIGGTGTIRVDVRLIGASNRNLEQLMRQGHFREDLYYRLNVFSISLPPLRERRTDIPLLVSHFLALKGASPAGPTHQITPDALGVLMRYSWPGNVRQLESIIERAVLMAEGRFITSSDLPLEVRQPAVDGDFAVQLPDAGISFEELEKNLILQALNKGSTLSRAARLLGMSRRTLQYRIAKFGLGRPGRGVQRTPGKAAPNGAQPAPDGALR